MNQLCHRGIMLCLLWDIWGPSEDWWSISICEIHKCSTIYYLGVQRKKKSRSVNCKSSRSYFIYLNGSMQGEGPSG